ncbi:guanylate kinase [Natronosporangium hydrolyticum]|uniref:Guanylate kinase n=1 Tax=Natronosporangium hydrolyticum TaxID=2811111 RepID=A0A895YHF8_9ACTN|nr:guanylate kinase [Natronosporangium hydrolyticum]
MTGAARPAARLLIVSGPSGAGRRRVIELARARSPDFWSPVPLTTRPRRLAEVDGREYTFVGRSDFDHRLAAGELIEWAELGGHRYGVPRAPIEEALRQGRPVLLSTDLVGAGQIRRTMPGAVLVYLTPPHRSDSVPAEFDVTIVTDTVVRAADKLVSLLGSPAFL